MNEKKSWTKKRHEWKQVMNGSKVMNEKNRMIESHEWKQSHAYEKQSWMKTKSCMKKSWKWKKVTQESYVIHFLKLLLIDIIKIRVAYCTVEMPHRNIFASLGI